MAEPPAYLSAFVSPSWTTRNAARSSPAGSDRRRALLVQLDGQARLAGPLDQLADAGHARLRRPRVVLVLVLVQHAEQAAHLGQRLAPGPLDLLGGGDRAGRVALEDPARAAGLHDHDADAVGHDVVHLARDPAALLGGGPRGLLRVGVLLALRGLVQLLGELRARAHRAAREPRDGAERGGEDVVADDLRGRQRS